MPKHKARDEVKWNEICIFSKCYTNIHLWLYIIPHMYQKAPDDKLQLNKNFSGGY